MHNKREREREYYSEKGIKFKRNLCENDYCLFVCLLCVVFFRHQTSLIFDVGQNK